VALFATGDFFGEGGMTGQTVRKGTATAIVPTTVLIIGKDEMVRALHAENELFRPFHHVHAGKEQPSRGGPNRSALQLNGKEIGAHPSTDRSLRQGRTARASASKGISRDAGRNNWYNALTSEYVHEKV